MVGHGNGRQDQGIIRLVARASAMPVCLSMLLLLGFDIDCDPSYEPQQTRCMHISDAKCQLTVPIDAMQETTLITR